MGLIDLARTDWYCDLDCRFILAVSLLWYDFACHGPP